MYFDTNISENKDGKKNEDSYLPCVTNREFYFTQESVFFFWFLTEEIQYHDGLRSRELGQAPILLCAPNS